MMPLPQPNPKAGPNGQPAEASDEQFRALFDHNIDAVILGTLEGGVVEANAAACTLFGWSRADMQKLGRGELVDLTDVRLPTLLANRDRRGSVRGQLRFRRRDHSLFEGNFSSLVFTDRQGKPRVSLIIRDISERVRAEEVTGIQRDLATRLAAATSVKEGLTLCLDAAIASAALDSGGFYLKDENSGGLTLAVHRGLSDEFVRTAQYYGSEAPQLQLVENGEAVYTNLDSLGQSRPENARREGLKLIAIVPFRAEGRVIGCLNLSSHSVTQLGDLERKALETIAASAALALARMRSDETLREQRVRLENIIAGTHVATWEWNAETNETVINETWATMVGYTLAELQPTTRATWERIVHPEDSRSSWDLLQLHMSGATPYYECECRLRHKAGHWIWVLNRGRVISRTPSGDPITVFGTHVEITSRKLTEAALRESEETHREIFNATEDAIYIHDATTGRVLDVNDGMLRMFGFASKEDYFSSSPLITFVAEAPYDMEEALRRMQLAMQGQPQVFEWKARKKTGEILWVDVSIRSAQIRGQPRILAVVRDHTRRKQAEKALGETEKQFAMAFHHSPSLMTLSRLDDGRFVDVNDRLVEVSGCRREEIIGHSSVELGWIKPEDRAHLAAIVRTSGRIKDHEIRMTFRDGRYIDVLFAGELIPSHGETLLLSNAVDITERKRAGAALRESEERFLKAFRRSPTLKTISRLSDGVYLDANDRFLEVFGLSREDVVGRKSTEVGLINEGQRARLMAGLQERNSIDKVPATLVAKDGRKVDVEFGCELIVIQGERCVLWSATDITLQNQTLAELQASEEKYRLLFDSNTGPMYVYDEETLQFLAVNDAAVAQYGWSREELLQLSLLDIRPPEDRDDVIRVVELTRGIRVKPIGIWRHRRKDGEVFQAEVTAASIRFAGKPGRLCSAVDVTERERLKAEANEMEERYRGLVESAFDGSVIHQNGIIVEVNQAYAQMFGYAVEELIGKPVLDMTAPAYHEIARNKIQTQSEEVYESVGLRKDGTRLPIETAGRSCTFRGQPARMAAVRDIAARKSAENALRTSEERYRSLLETTADWVWEVDANGRYTYASPRVQDMLGLTPAEIVGRTPFDLMPEEEAQRVGALFQTFAANRAPIVALENTLRHRDGQLVVVETNGIPTFGQHGDWTGYRGMDRDITASREAARTLRLHGAALEVAGNSVMITDRKGVIEWVNPAFTALSGWSFAEAVGQTPGALLNSDAHEPEFYQQIIDTIKTGKNWHGEIVTRRKDGSKITEDMTVTPLRDGSGDITHYISIKQDISERKMLEAQNRQAQRMEAIGTLAGGMAHDLNNILAPMLMIFGLLKEKLTNEKDQQMLAMLDQGARRGADIIRQLLTFSRGSPGELVNLQPRHILKEIMNLMRETFPREIDLSMNLAHSLPVILADPTQLHQVVLNICVNARDAMPDGGHIWLSAKAVQLAAGDPLLPLTVTPGRFVFIEIRDSGYGIPPAIKDRIFDPFFTTKPLGKGTGLGLSTTIGIVRSYGGFIRVESEPGRGAAFQIYLPSSHTDVIAASAEPEDKPARGTGQLVLVVDDERDIREACRLALEFNGYRVLLASQGEDALAQFKKHRREIALVVTDLMMPVMGGVALLKTLRDLSPQLPVIAMSGLAGPEKRQKLAEVGINEVMDKPFSSHDFLTQVQRALEKNP